VNSRLLAFFSHPLLGISASVASIVAIPMSIYFYRASVAAPKLTYYVHPARATVVKAGTASAIAVTYNGKMVATDITAAQVAIWNAGKLPVRRSDILKPLTIKTTPSVPILEAAVRKLSRDVTHLTLNSAAAAQGEISIDFDIMEQDDGCVIQLLYAGLVDVPVEVIGSIVGQRTPAELHFSGSVSSPADQYEQLKRKNRVVGLVAMSCGLIFAVLIPIVWKLGPRAKRSLNWLDRFMFAMPYLLIGLGVFTLYIGGAPEPPFGFR
jgi:hypothetical protein